MKTSIILLILGFVFLIKGADFLVKGASDIAVKLRIPDIVIGVTVVAIGTSMPELFVSVSSAISGLADLSIGNVIGSSICNLLLILGLTSIIKPINMDIENTESYICFSILAATMLLAMGNFNSDISRFDGFILLLGFLAFIIYTIIVTLKPKKNKSTDIEKLNQNEENIMQSDTVNNKLIYSFLYVIVGIILLKFGGDFVVNSSTQIARLLNISEKIIGLTIVAVGTCLPELITSSIATFRGNSNMAVGNVIGSNILNIFLILGVAAIIKPINYSVSFNSDLILLLISTLTFWVFKDIGQKNTVTRSKGSILLATYFITTIALFIK